MPHRMQRLEEEPEPAAKETRVSLGTLKWVFDASWKVLPALWFAFQFYANQTALSKDMDSNRKTIEKLQTDVNELSRKETEAAVSIKALRDIQDNDRQFFLETHPARPRR
jgi:hypothetical protein